jgi:hypothetical protein
MQALRAGLTLGQYRALVTAQWLLLTCALAALLVYASTALDDYISPTLGTPFLLFGPLLLCALLGVTVSSLRLALGLSAAMCVLASIIFGLVIYAPATLDIIPGGSTLQSYAAQQAFIVMIWTFLPGCGGGLLGHMLGTGLRRGILRSEVQETAAWWVTGESGNRESGTENRG